MGLSLVIITKNEYANLTRLLPAVQNLADEIIIYDNSDREQNQSALLAARYGAKFYRSPLKWQGFGKQRQRAQMLAQHDWILMLDADEIPDAEMQQDIRRITRTAPQNTVYGMRRVDLVGEHAVDSKLIRLKPYWRLYPKRFGFDDTLVHESLVLNGAPTAVLNGYAEHHTAPDFAFLLQKRLNYANAWATQRYANQPHPKRFGVGKMALGAVGSWVKQALVEKRLLCGKAGLLFACLFAQYTFNKYALLYAAQQSEQSQSALYAELQHNLTHALQNPQSALGVRLPFYLLYCLAKRFATNPTQARGTWRWIDAFNAMHHAFNQRVRLSSQPQGN